MRRRGWRATLKSTNILRMGRPWNRPSVEPHLARSPLRSLAARRNSSGLLVLAYHEIADPVRFETQLLRLMETRRPVSLDELTQTSGSLSWPSESCALVTFDDGDPSVLEVGLPILRRLGVPAVAFVVTSLLNSSSPYWWDEVTALMRSGARVARLGDDPAFAVRLLKRMPNSERLDLILQLRDGHPLVVAKQLTSVDVRHLRDSGIAIGNHTSTHPCLDQCTDAELRSEIHRAHEQLADMLGEPPLSFAYPNGNWDARAEQVLRKLGYTTAMLFDHRFAKRGTHPLRLSRVRVASTTEMDRFELLISGLHPWLHHLRNRE